jgi:hypothetical protein
MTSAAVAAPPASSPSSSTSPQELHVQALEAMQRRQLEAAVELMEKAYNATPAAQRTRPLVLNRAIIDLTQRINVMRAVRDVSKYLRDHPEPDEQAQNILGAALNIAVTDMPRWRNGPLWQSAFQEWDRRDAQLTEARPGYRRWATQWLEEKQYQQMEADRTELERAVEEQAANVDRARTRVAAVRARYTVLAITAAELRQQMVQGPQQTQQQPIPGPGSVNVTLDGSSTLTETPLGSAGAWAGNGEARARAIGEIVVANGELQAEQTRLANLKRALAGMRPTWPATFDPIDLAALTAPPPPPPDPKAMAAIVEAAVKEKTLVNSPFSASGAAKRGPQVQPPAAQPPPAPTTAPVAAPPAADVPFAPRTIDKR